MAEIDDILSASLKRVAQPGDATGVADAIRSRVDAGDTGTPASSSGFGGGGIVPWLPWIGMVLVAGLTGASLAVTGVFAVAAPEPPVSQIRITVGDGVAAAGCPGGPAVVRLERGQRVLAVERSDDSGYLGLRDPSDISRTVWLPAGVVSIDDGQPAVDTLPVGGCAIAEPLVTAAPVVPVPVEPGDTSAPSISNAYATPKTIYNNDVTTLHVVASDDVGVSGVTMSWSGAASGSASMSLVGGEWQATFSSNDTSPGSYGIVQFSFVANDDAGNSSSPATATVDRQYFG